MPGYAVRDPQRCHPESALQGVAQLLANPWTLHHQPFRYAPGASKRRLVARGTAAALTRKGIVPPLSRRAPFRHFQAPPTGAAYRRRGTGGPGNGRANRSPSHHGAQRAIKCRRALDHAPCFLRAYALRPAPPPEDGLNKRGRYAFAPHTGPTPIHRGFPVIA